METYIESELKEGQKVKLLSLAPTQNTLQEDIYLKDLDLLKKCIFIVVYNKLLKWNEFRIVEKPKEVELEKLYYCFMYGAKFEIVDKKEDKELTQDQKNRISEIDFLKLRQDIIYLKSLCSNLFTKKENETINDFIETSISYQKDINK